MFVDESTALVRSNEYENHLFQMEGSLCAIIHGENKFTNDLLLEMWLRACVCVWVLSVQTECSSSPGRIDMNILSLTGSTDG